jgi:hypothetical protein
MARATVAAVRVHVPAIVGSARATRDLGAERGLDLECARVVVEVFDHLITRRISRKRIRKRPERQCGQALRRVQVQAIVVAAPRGADGIATLEDLERDTPAPQRGSDGEPGRSGADDERAAVVHGIGLLGLLPATLACPQPVGSSWGKSSRRRRASRSECDRVVGSISRETNLAGV